MQERGQIELSLRLAAVMVVPLDPRTLGAGPRQEELGSAQRRILDLRSPVWLPLAKRSREHLKCGYSGF